MRRGRKAASRARTLLAGAAIALALVAVCALLWRFTPLQELARPRNIAARLEAVESMGWAPFAFIAAYLVGGLVMFPVTVLSAASAILFVPYKAAAVSVTGIMLSAAMTHWLGARFVRGRAKQALSGVIERVDAALTDRGVVTIAAIRMIPIAPFSLVNVAAGALGVPLRDFMLGTLLGLAPGVTIVCLFGRQVRAFWRDPSLGAVLWAVAIAILWIAMSVALQRWVARRHAGQG